MSCILCVSMLLLDETEQSIREPENNSLSVSIIIIIIIIITMIIIITIIIIIHIIHPRGSRTCPLSLLQGVNVLTICYPVQAIFLTILIHFFTVSCCLFKSGTNFPVFHDENDVTLAYRVGNLLILPC